MAEQLHNSFIPVLISALEAEHEDENMFDDHINMEMFFAAAIAM